MKTHIILVLLLSGCATQYIPTKQIDIGCTPPPDCPDLPTLHKETFVNDLLTWKQTYLVCKAGVDSFNWCVNKQKKL